jgi:hypothetical protein
MLVINYVTKRVCRNLQRDQAGQFARWASSSHGTGPAPATIGARSPNKQRPAYHFSGCTVTGMKPTPRSERYGDLAGVIAFRVSPALSGDP